MIGMSEYAKIPKGKMCKVTFFSFFIDESTKDRCREIFSTKCVTFYRVLRLNKREAIGAAQG